MSAGRRILVVACIALSTLSALAPLGAQGIPHADAVRGSFIFNVASFVEWPARAFESPSAPLRIAVVSPHEVPEIAATLRGKAIRGHALAVETYESADQIGKCHVVFVTADAAPQLRGVLKNVAGEPVLTIAEDSPETPGSAVVSVGVEQARLAFVINLDAADAAGLQMNPNLLKLAKRVHGRRFRSR